MRASSLSVRQTRLVRLARLLMRPLLRTMRVRGFLSRVHHNVTLEFAINIQSQFALHQRTSAPGFSDALESLAAIQGDEMLRGDAVVRRSGFETRGLEALSARSVEGRINQFGGDSFPTMLLIHCEI